MRSGPFDHLLHHGVGHVAADGLDERKDLVVARDIEEQFVLQEHPRLSCRVTIRTKNLRVNTHSPENQWSVRAQPPIKVVQQLGALGYRDRRTVPERVNQHIFGIGVPVLTVCSDGRATVGPGIK